MAESTPSSPQPNSGDSSQPSAPPAAPPRRRWLWLKRLLILVVLLGLLVALLPTLASTSLVRGMVLRQVNKSLRGQADIQDWSLGWFTGVDVKNVRLMDEQGAVVLSVGRVRSTASLAGLIRGNLDLGQVLIDDPDLANVVVGPDGITNIQRILGLDQPSQGEITVPDLKAAVTVSNLRGRIITPDVSQPFYIEPSRLSATIDDINGPIRHDIQIACRAGDGPRGTIQITGEIDLIEGNKVDLSQLAMDGKVSLAGVEVAAVNPFLKLAGVALLAKGAVDGSLQVTAAGLSGTTAQGQIDIASASVGGAAMAGDTYAARKISIPVNIWRVGEGAQARLKADVRVKFDHGELAVAADAPEQSLSRAAGLLTSLLLPPPAERNVPASIGPLQPGSVQVRLDVTDAAGIANQLPHLLKLLEDTRIESGKLALEAKLEMAPSRLSVATSLSVADVAGRSNGKPVRLANVSFTGKAAAQDTLANLRDLAAQLSSAFAGLDGGGASLADQSWKAEIDIGKLHAELAQFVDIDQYLAGATKAAALLKDEKINIDLAGGVDLAKGVTVKLSSLSLASSSGLLTLQKSPDRELVLGLGEGNVKGSGAVQIGADLLRGAQIARALGYELSAEGRPGELLGGRLGGTIRLNRADQPLSLVEAEFDLTGVNVRTSGRPMRNQPVRITLKAAVPDDMGQVDQLQVAVTSELADVTVKDARLALFTGQGEQRRAVSPMHMAQAGTIDVNVPDVARLMTLAAAFSPPGAPATRPSIELRGGAVQANATLTRELGKAILKDATIALSKITLANGPATWVQPADKPITLALAASLDAVDDPKLTPAQQIRSVNITQLSGDLLVGKLSMPKAIAIANPAGAISASGSIELSGKIADASSLLAVLQGKAGADALPFAGDFAVSQAVNTRGDVVQLAGSANVNKFTVTRDGKVMFSEDQLAIANDLGFDTAKQSLAINTLKVDARASGVVKVDVIGGKISDLSGRRTIDPMQIKLAYDLPKVWEIVRPLLSAEQLASLGDVKVAGKQERQFTLSGAFPAGKPFNEAIQLLKVEGSIGADRIEAAGATVENLDLPLRLDNGVLSVPAAARPDGSDAATALVNGGKLRLAGASLDLTQPDLRITLPPGLKVLEGVSINAVFARRYLGGVLPILSSVPQSGGQIDLAVVSCERLALASLTGGPLPKDPGRAQLTFAIRELIMGGGFIGTLLTLADVPGGRDARTMYGDVRDGKIYIENGRVRHVMPIQVSRDDTLKLDGTMSLADLTYSPLNIGVPGAWMKVVSRDLARFLPEHVEMPFAGPVTDLKIAPGFVQKLARDAAARALLGGGRAPATTQAAPPDPAGALIDILRGKPQEPQPRQPQVQPAPPKPQPEPEPPPTTRRGPRRPRQPQP